MTNRPLERVSGASDQMYARLSKAIGAKNEQIDYLQQLAERLNHEIKTPVSIVRSSLANLDPSNEQKAFVDRANKALHRLTSTLNLMTEATRLEQALRREDDVSVDLRSLIADIVAACTDLRNNIKVSGQLPDAPVSCTGIPEQLAQMMDKLISNAIDFATPNTTITVRLKPQADHAIIEVENIGPRLPEIPDRTLFSALVSIRDHDTKTSTTDASPTHHLGLGLYVVGTIARYHDGTLSANSRSDPDGVIMSIMLPTLRLTSRLS